MNYEYVSQQAQLVVVSLQALCLDSDAYKAISSYLNADGQQILRICQSLKNHKNLSVIYDDQMLREHAKWVLRGYGGQSRAYLAVIFQCLSVQSQEPFNELLPFIWNPHDDGYYTVLYEAYITKYIDFDGGLPSKKQFRENLSEFLGTLKISLKGEWNVVWKYIPEKLPTVYPPNLAVSFNWRLQIRSIYTGLVCVEEACSQKSECLLCESPDVSLKEIQELISLVWFLLHLHLEIFQMSESQCVGFALKQFPEKHEMPQRMWQYGIGPLLDLLRENPDSFEESVNFQAQSYEMMGELMEIAPAFRHIWIDCLGHLARFRLAIHVDTEDFMVWAGRAEKWYLQVSARQPNEGRPHHHLAIVSLSDIVKQLFHHTKSLLSVEPFIEPSSTEQSICFLLDRIRESEHHDLLKAFSAVHEHFIKNCSIPGLRAPVKDYLSQLSKYIGQADKVFKQQGAYMLLCNFAVIFQYGFRDALLPHTFESVLLQQEEESVQIGDASEVILCGSYFAFETFSIILDQFRNENVYPAVYVGLIFILCMSCNDTTDYIDAVVPWGKIVAFLNGMLCNDTDFSVIEGNKMPIVGDTKQLPEDFLVHGYIWSRGYFPNNFFENAMTDDGCSVEEPSMDKSRAYRCLWLARQLYKYFEYSQNGFALTALAQEHEKATPYDPFDFEGSSSGDDA